MNHKEAAPILQAGKKTDRTNDQFEDFQKHIGVGKQGNTSKEDGGLYANQFRGMNNGTDLRSENLLVNEDEAPDKLPPNMPNFGHDEKFIRETMAILELGETNGNLEMIRLNKKFDIFLKRFMKMEEDIKEIKNNFFRVMHCAFAKYEEGFKRKNEYLERRRAKKRYEIETGV